MSRQFLPYGRHQIDEDDIAAVVEVLQGATLTCGPKVEEFEAAFAGKIGAAHAVVCSNGTTALHLACMGANLQPGDVAIVPAITFLATANAVRMTGAEVVFADVDPETGLMTPDTLREAINRAGSKAKAVLPVHMNGQSDDMAELSTLARHHGLKIITDCCHTLGAEYTDGSKPGDGRFEDFGTFSLHPVKSIAMGEGGVVTLNDNETARRLRSLRGHAMEKAPDRFLHADEAFDSDGIANPWYYEMQELAYNYRASDMQCALGLSQLKKLDTFITRRRILADQYDAALKPLDNLLQPIRRSKTCLSAWHLYPVLIDFAAAGMSRSALMKALAAEGVGTQVHYLPVSRQPYYTERYGKQNLPGADGYYARVLSLPIFPAMMDSDIQHVAEVLAHHLGA